MIDGAASDEAITVRTRAVLWAIGAIPQREGGGNWLPGIRAALAALDPAPGVAAWTPRDGLREAASIYRAMTRGPGSFGDFYIARADPTEQAEANQRYGELADELWRLLGDVR